MKSAVLTLLLSCGLLTVKAQYCTPSYGSGTGSGDYISLVEIVGTTLNNSSGGASNPYFTLFPGSGSSTASMNMLVPYQINVTGGTYGTCYISAWGDWNRNGVFESSEFIGVSPNAGALTMVNFGNITIPASAGPGVVRLRFRSSDTSPGPSPNESCGNTNSSYGETEDYEITVLPFPACSGTPTAGIANASSTLVCPSQPVTFDLNSATTGVNLDYQWQSSPDNSTWTNVGTVQQNYNYSVSSITTPTYFRCVVTCTSSSLSDYSQSVLVNVNPPLNCYCTIDLANGNTVDCTQDKIADFSISNVTSQTTNCDSYGYSDSTASNYTSVNLTAGNTYTLMVNTALSGINGDGIVGAWIDYDQNTVFDANEYVTVGIGPSGTYSTTLTLPITVNTGVARMRMILDAYYADGSTILGPCTNNPGGLGQVVDYKVNFTAAPACSGAPNAGNAVSTATNVCPVDSYTLNLSGNDLVSGISYQWQSSPDGSAWTNLGPAQNTIPYAVASQTATTWYRCLITCTSSSLTGTSAAITVNQNLPTACYCTPDNINCGSSQINNVVFEGINDYPSCNPNGYINNTASVVTASLTANQTYTISTDINVQFGNGYLGCWIDYDQSGTFDPNEYTELGNQVTIGAITGTINVPFTAIGGDTRMRIKLESSYNPYTGLDACMAYMNDGETVDYMVNITPSAPCAGTPNAGDATSSTTLTCQNSPFTLDLTGNDVVGNMSYQWQSSPDNTVWTNMGALQSFVPYSVTSQSVAMYYRCIVTCTSASLSATSTPIAVSQNAFSNCYCIPGMVDCSGGDEINNVVFAAISNTSACNSNLSGYDDYTAAVPSATIHASQTYTMDVTLGYDYNENVSVWIDFDHSGSFEASEYTFLGSSSGSGNYVVSGSVTIPANAMLGVTRMRVRNFNNTVLGPDDACAVPLGGGSRMSNSRSTLGTSYGETEDYLVDILPPDCSTINFPPSMSVTGNTNICSGQLSTLDLSPQLQLATGITYQWNSSTTGTFTPDGAETSASTFTAAPFVTTYYYCDVLCNGSVIRTSDTASVQVHIVSATPSFTNTSCNSGCDGAIQLNASSTYGGALTYSWTPTVGSADMVVALCAGSYSVTITNSLSCTATQTFIITEPAAITSSNTVTDVTCNGLGNGSATVTASGGTGSYTYSWTPGGATTDNVSGLAPGTYTYMVSDMNGCNITNTLAVNEPLVLSATITQTNISCFGLTDGMADANVTGGTAGYSYTWSPGGSNSASVNGLAAGSYVCDISDVNGCTTSSVITITMPGALTATSSQTNITCFGGNDGSASVTATGGTVGSGYTYFWSGGFGAAGNTISGNVTAGTYTCTITDANNCTFDQVMTLTEAPQILLSITGSNSLCEFSTTTYTVSSSNAVGSVTYTWTTSPSAQSSNATTLTYTAPAAGSETVYVSATDANGCTQTNSSFLVNIASSTNISGTATVQTTGVPVAGDVILYKYEPFFTKFDSIDTKTLDASGNYSFNSTYSGTYIVKVVPTLSSLQITYGNSEINWKTAHQISHGCAGNAIENIAVIPLSTFTTSGSGSLSGTIYEGQGYGHRLSQVAVPGNPIGGIIVKGGKNPGGQMFVQTTTGANGTYTLANLPPNGPGEEYFILVDIPGLDTNNTYHKVISISNNSYTNLDFVVDSAKINPVSNVSVHDLSAIENQIKVFPNPASSNVTIQYSLVANSSVSIELYDIFGKSVRTIQPQTEQSIHNHTYSVGLDGLASGMYFVKLKINNAESVIKLFITN